VSKRSARLGISAGVNSSTAVPALIGPVDYAEILARYDEIIANPADQPPLEDIEIHFKALAAVA
jgi:hypothetical protein